MAVPTASDKGRIEKMNPVMHHLLAGQGMFLLDADNDVWIFTNAGTPADGAVGTGTGAGITGPSTLCLDYSNAKLYSNTGTKASPTWTELPAV